MKLFKHEYFELNIGLVQENYVIVKTDEINIWKERGFKVIKKYPIFHYIPNRNEKIMLGKPKMIHEFGINNLIGCEIIDFSSSGGTYGMGGPGFVEFKFISKNQEKLWLTFAMWGAGEYILLDNKVLECHPKFFDEYNPWLLYNDLDETQWNNTWSVVKKMFIGGIIKNIELHADDGHIDILDLKGILHRIWTAKYSSLFPPKGGSGERNFAFKTQKLADSILIHYDDSHLVV